MSAQGIETEWNMQHDLLLRLKDETAACHTRLENALDLMRNDWSREEYVALLERFFGYVAVWEDAVGARLPAHLQAFFDARRKAALLADDLAVLTGDRHRAAIVPLAKESATLPALDTTARVFGSMYVMEGSTLGGRFIAPHVAGLFGLTHGRGNAYFDGYGPRTGSMWKAFRETAAATVSAGQYDDAVAAAIETFDGLHAWLAGERVAQGALA
jgi:heme oxygenase